MQPSHPECSETGDARYRHTAQSDAAVQTKVVESTVLALEHNETSGIGTFELPQARFGSGTSDGLSHAPAFRLSFCFSHYCCKSPKTCIQKLPWPPLHTLHYNARCIILHLAIVLHLLEVLNLRQAKLIGQNPSLKAFVFLFQAIRKAMTCTIQLTRAEHSWAGNSGSSYVVWEFQTTG